MGKVMEQTISAHRYSIKSHETYYKGVLFRSRLEARWAAFFDIIGFKWEYEPIDLEGWTPDFRLTFPCGHSECPDNHTILVEVKPYYSIEEFIGHPCLDYSYGVNDNNTRIPADASAAFGINPDVTHWEMEHGAGGGFEEIKDWIDHRIDVELAWNISGNVVRYNPRNLTNGECVKLTNAARKPRRAKITPAALPELRIVGRVHIGATSAALPEQSDGVTI